ncbi:protelomerase family protein [Enterobacter hormaechei]|uniref:protelomerase family protein n=1 Tax=Enterobacter TaxID=547 RepID=UPI000794C98D|nr:MULTISPECIES: protelomerase family protein [Enterobacter]QLU74717.1 protelomerase [Enterobacter cloacae]HDT3543633.1 protelomerase [Enterobacter hormaechei subsp. steigerwaltii]HED2316049.1 protelomerase [Enterobacter hormaechei subsp. hoffmannii]ELC7456473.1 protelomerase [Enterobacter hormaechei]ELD4144573.1 protelomerase [Enterobacter hormaechei]
MSKVKIGELINALVNEVEAIDASDRPQGDKTKRIKAAAARYKNALFNDKRKFRGKGLQKRITANTFNAYMSRARKRFDDKLHHSFDKNIHKLSEKYPLYSEELSSWLSMPTANIRQNMSALQSKLKSIMPLAEELSNIKLGVKGSDAKLTKLTKKYPDWSFAISDLCSDDWKERRDYLYKLFQQGSSLLEELHHLKVNHEVLYHLQLSPAERTSIQQRWADVLREKKRSVVVIDYPKYMQSIYDILNSPATLFSLNTRSGMAPLAFALAAVSGRRMIEIMFQGEFTVSGKYTVNFSGQAKKRTEDKNVTRTIYTLCEAKLFVELLTELRSCSAASDFDEVIQGYGKDDTRSENGRINAILAKAFNPWVKTFFGDERRVYKDSRAIYARIAYEMFFRVDPRWKNVDEDVFFMEILGHDDENTQLHYKQFKLANFSRTWRPDVGDENTRLVALQKLDDEMPGFARGDAGVRLHETVKQLVEQDPSVKITNSTLRAYKFSPTMISRYLEFAADALGQFVGENGQWQLKVEAPAIVLPDEDAVDAIDEPEDEPQDDELDDDEIEVDEDGGEEHTEEKEPEENQQAALKPVFKPAKNNGDGTYQIEFEYDGKHYAWSGPADSPMAAMRSAWETYHS